MTWAGPARGLRGGYGSDRVWPPVAVVCGTYVARSSPS